MSGFEIKSQSKVIHPYCPVCHTRIFPEEEKWGCTKCGELHHISCKNKAGKCCSLSCNPSQTFVAPSSIGVLKISANEIASATPMVIKTVYNTQQMDTEIKPKDKTYNKTAVWSFVIALLGIPLFGIITGLVAMIVALIAMMSHTARNKGLIYAFGGVLIGFIDIAGWTAGIAYYMSPSNTAVSLNNFQVDPESENNLPDAFRKSMYANVLVIHKTGILGLGFGSGVIIKNNNGKAIILTNRHVVDGNYSDSKTNIPADLKSLGDLSIQTLKGESVRAELIWLAPHGVDLALLSVELNDKSYEAVTWKDTPSVMIGEELYAVGNPHGLGWTLTKGSVSQLRQDHKNGMLVRIIQSTVPLNKGNSGGGLYDKEGNLVGINSMVGNPSVSEGLGFSIHLSTFLELVPDAIGVKKQK